ncbi:hypothetical protein P3L44_12430 [Providencia sp. PROV175]|uniref:hypothetical protein n=1 Tax=Providencia sp. PROV175 TaxID=2949878 RepID=UPI00234A6BC9|nr:hypothetical protein [Providencia sp. PROV175]WOB89528.1 hypothetical protein P3L44_12430 [Providencia sp. PROV175]
MQYSNNLDTSARLYAIESALAYTITAISHKTPSVKNNIINALRFDSDNNNNSATKEALLALAALIESFEVTQS